MDAAVIVDQAELAKAVHKKADAGSYSANHLRQGFLRNGRVYWLAAERKNGNAGLMDQCAGLTATGGGRGADFNWSKSASTSCQ
jgi:hypothetical protein